MAKELGIDVSREEMMAFVHAKENMQKAQTEKANQTVKEALGDHDLDQVAGGGANGGALIYCKDTFEQGENCWFADDCNMIINDYEGAEGFVFYELVDDVGNGGWMEIAGGCSNLSDAFTYNTDDFNP